MSQLADLSLIKFYFSGELNTMSVEEAKKRVIENGGIVRDKIVNDLWYLVSNKPDPKNEEIKRAKDLGVLFINEKEFLKMLT